MSFPKEWKDEKMTIRLVKEGDDSLVVPTEFRQWCLKQPYCVPNEDCHCWVYWKEMGVTTVAEVTFVDGKCHIFIPGIKSVIKPKEVIWGPRVPRSSREEW